MSIPALVRNRWSDHTSFYQRRIQELLEMDASAQELQPRECIWDSIKAYRFMDKMHFEKCFPVGQPSYKDLYEDDEFMYRLVILSEQHSKLVPSSSIPLYEHEWRSIGIRQSAGWQHMACYRGDPHLLIFRKDKHPEAS